MDERILYANLIIFVAFFIRSLTGFGAGLIAIPILALMYPLRFAVPLQLLFEIGTSAILLPRVWRDVDWRQIVPLLSGLCIGNVTGAWVLAHTGDSILKAVLAVVVLLFSAYLAWTAKTPLTWKIDARWGILFGLGGGLFGGSLGMSGPIVVLYLSQQLTGKQSLRASLIALFSFASLWTAAAHTWNGLYTAESFRTAVWLLPAFLLGTWLGHKAHDHVSELLFRRIIAGLLFGSGLLLVFS